MNKSTTATLAVLVFIGLIVLGLRVKSAFDHSTDVIGDIRSSYDSPRADSPRRDNDEVGSVSNSGVAILDDTPNQFELRDDDFVLPVDDDMMDPAVIDAFLSERPISRYRIVKVNSDLLRSRIRRANQVDRFHVRLFTDVDLEVQPVGLDVTGHTEGYASGFDTWSGKIVGEERSSILIIARPDGGVRGIFKTPSGLFHIFPSDYGDYHFVLEVDPEFTVKND